MRKHKAIIITLITISIYACINVCKAEERKIISGTVTSSTTGETIIGAIIYLKEKNSVGTSTDNYGRYSLNVPVGEWSIIYSYIGCKSDTIKINVIENKSVNVELKDNSIEADAVVVESHSAKQRVSQAVVGVDRVSIKEIKNIPVIFGEKDIIKTMQLLPGVKSSSDGNAGFTVRGGSLDQNLILLDEAPVYNASHMLGFFSTFNSAAIKDAVIYKGNYPAQYGGRVASVVDVKMNDGNNKNYVGSVGIGLISSNLSFEGPIQKNKSSFLVTARRTYADLIAGIDPQYRGNELNFYDVNIKANVEINPKNRLYISGYLGQDVTKLNDMGSIKWGNTTGTLRWNSIVSPTLFSNTMIIYSNYNNDIKSWMKDLSGVVKSKIEDVGIKQDFQLSVGQNGGVVRMGLTSTMHTITPTRFEDGDFTNPGPRTPKPSLESAIYASYSGNFWKFLNIEAGLRYSIYNVVGGGTYNLFDKGEKQGSIHLNNGQFGKTYMNLEPRVSASFLLNQSSSLKIAYSRASQYFHMLSNSSAALPTDQWIGSSYTVKPTVADQISGGFFKNIASIGLEFSVEGYYKWLTDEVDYKSGADIFGAQDIEGELLIGEGRAYGVEFLLRKNSGWFTGWIGYTWSKTERRIEGINNNKWYPTRQDKTHEISIVTMFNLGKGWEMSAVWCFSTGAAMTVPTGKYLVEGFWKFLYSERNGYRMPNYHRLDIGATYNAPKKKGLQGTWNFSIYNAYGRENPFIIKFDTNKDTNKTTATQVSLFRWVPSVSYILKFQIGK